MHLQVLIYFPLFFFLVLLQEKMKFFLFLVLFILFINCSFDNKTGIWKNENSTVKSKNDIFKEFSEIILSEEDFNKTVELEKNFSFKLKKPKENFEWLVQ